jgi:hypothetical protein
MAGGVRKDNLVNPDPTISLDALTAIFANCADLFPDHYGF